MSKIYRDAEKVIAWLGEDYSLSPNPLKDPTAHALIASSNPSYPVSLLLRPYWCRTWIVQEYISSTRMTVLLGQTETDWDLF
jgi:hypothetical protein